MAICPECGSEVDSSKQFCADCGTRLDRQADDADTTGSGGATATSDDTVTGTDSNPTDGGVVGNDASATTDHDTPVGNETNGMLASLTRDQQIVIGGGILTVISAFLPWASAFGISAAGTNGDGVFTLLLGAAAAAVVYFEPLDGRNLAAAGILGVLIALIGIVNVSGVAAIGVYLTVLGGVIVAYPWVSQVVASNTDIQPSR